MWYRCIFYVVAVWAVFFENCLHGSKLIKSLHVSETTLTIVPHVSLRKYFLNREPFKVSYAKNVGLYNLDFTVQSIPFVMCIMPLVWYSGKKFVIDAMDHDLYHSLKKIQHVFRLFYPSLRWSGSLKPRTLVKNRLPLRTNNSEVAVLFSGGLDAVCTSFNHLNRKQLLITINGCDVPLNRPNMWSEVQKRSKEYAKTYGHANAFATFNYYSTLDLAALSSVTKEISSWWGHTLGSLSHAGIAAPIAYAYGLPELYFAASSAQERPEAYGNHPLIDNNLRCAGVQVVHDGTVTRQEKVRSIYQKAHEYNVSLPHLRVCRAKMSRGRNCGRCIPKCLLTMNSIVVEGLNPRDFGFNTSLAKIMRRTKALFAGRKKVFDWGTVWHYQCMQQRAAEVVADKELLRSYDPEIREYLTWYIKIDLTQYTAGSQGDYEATKRYFTTLWKLAFTPSTKQLFALRPRRDLTWTPG